MNEFLERLKQDDNLNGPIAIKKRINKLKSPEKEMSNHKGFHLKILPNI